MDDLMQGKGFTQNMPMVINGALDPAILVEAQNSEDDNKFAKECPDSNNSKTKRRAATNISMARTQRCLLMGTTHSTPRMAEQCLRKWTEMKKYILKLLGIRGTLVT